MKTKTKTKIELRGGASWWRVCYQQGLPRLVLLIDSRFTCWIWTIRFSLGHQMHISVFRRCLSWSSTEWEGCRTISSSNQPSKVQSFLSTQTLALWQWTNYWSGWHFLCWLPTPSCTLTGVAAVITVRCQICLTPSSCRTAPRGPYPQRWTSLEWGRCLKLYYLWLKGASIKIQNNCISSRKTLNFMIKTPFRIYIFFCIYTRISTKM